MKNNPTTATGIYVNLPVKNLQKSIDFFTALGFAFNPQFTDDTGTCMIVGENMCVMLLTHDKFNTFAPNSIGDARKSNEVIVCLGVQSREKVDELVRKGVAAGGNTHNAPDDHGFMYGHGFQDLDGHLWEFVHMDMAAFEKAQKGA
jgi:predicted lactoylglutathione lyase